MHSPCSAPVFPFGTSTSGATKIWCAVIDVSTMTQPSTKPKTQISTHHAAVRRHALISGLTLEPGSTRSKAQYKRLHIPAADVWGIRLFQRSPKVSDFTHLSETRRIILIRFSICKRKNKKINSRNPDGFYSFFRLRKTNNRYEEICALSVPWPMQGRHLSGTHRATSLTPRS